MELDYVDEYDEFQISLLGLAVMPFEATPPPSPRPPLASSLRGVRTSSPISPPRRLPLLAPAPLPPRPPRPAAASLSLLGECVNAKQFCDMFKATNKVKSLRIELEGTFTLQDARLELQFCGQYQPIPHGVTCTFTMYMERWRSSIHYVLNEQGKTALKFTIESIRTGQVTSMTETSKQTKARQISRRCVIIGNHVFDRAWRALTGMRMADIGGTNESATLFGLKHPQMKDFVLKWYQEQAGSV